VLFAKKVGKGRPEVALHGFTQTQRSWLPVAQRLSADHQFTLVDAPGHGGSADVRADLWRGAQLLADVGGRADYIGYSMGARVCLHLALLRPELVTRLVLIGAHPGIVDPDERARRVVDDDALAQRLEADGVGSFVDWWLEQPLFSTLDATAAGRDDRLTNTAAGLASSLRLTGTGRQEPLWERLGELAMPVLVVAGEGDAKFASLGREMAAAIGGNAELVLIADAGHACHLERPDEFSAVLAEFLDSTTSRAH
jgi:2-succinyl-6-hydroxy-2,4-cyclohexadiene-1-carboxylate synthase